MTVDTVRGAGRVRAGATDTAMLIWKVIEGNPGITRSGIWDRVEQAIPAGYACRAYGRYLRTRGRMEPADGAAYSIRARNYVLTERLKRLRQGGAVTCEGDGPERRYTVAREINYRGDPAAIDVDGSKAADHMAVADALILVEKMIARANLDRKYGAPLTGSRKDHEALKTLVKALRAKSG